MYCTPALSHQRSATDRPCQTTGLLLERLQAWKHACGYLENYITATEKMEKHHAKEYDKVLKVRRLSAFAP